MSNPLLGRSDAEASTKEVDVMSEKSLLSLREIARELNLNYRTMIDIKNQFLSFLPAQTDGKNNKFSPECVDFFQLIFALRDEGYTCEMIRMMLLKKNPLPEASFISLKGSHRKAGGFNHRRAPHNNFES